MSLISSRYLLRAAHRDGYAIGAFQVDNMEMIQAVIAAAEAMRAPVILQTAPDAVRCAGLDMLYAMASAAAFRTDIPVALHLDQGESLEVLREAARIGYTSMMIDGRGLDFEENAALTCRVVDAMGDRPVEAGLSEGSPVDPDRAQAFVRRTGIASLAVRLGPQPDLELLSRIQAQTGVPMALHGVSDLTDGQLRKCIDRGVAKVNCTVEAQRVYSEGVKACIAQNPGVFDPKRYGQAGREALMALVKDRIALFGCGGKA